MSEKRNEKPMTTAIAEWQLYMCLRSLVPEISLFAAGTTVVTMYYSVNNWPTSQAFACSLFFSTFMHPTVLMC